MKYLQGFAENFVKFAKKLQSFSILFHPKSWLILYKIFTNFLQLITSVLVGSGLKFHCIFQTRLKFLKNFSWNFFLMFPIIYKH